MSALIFWGGIAFWALVGAVVAIVVGLILHTYLLAAAGYVRVIRLAKRKGVSVWAGKPPRCAAIRMIHYQAGHGRDYRLDGVIVPWRPDRPIKREFIGA